jgi:hypothetical protein
MAIEGIMHLMVYSHDPKTGKSGIQMVDLRLVNGPVFKWHSKTGQICPVFQ